MERVRLVHWNAQEAVGRADALRALGYEVDARPVTPAALRSLGREAPDALVVDLSRLPSQGRDVAIVVRRSRAGRHVPIVFAGGAADKAARVRETLPDALFSAWERIGPTLRATLAEPVRDPVVPARVSRATHRPRCRRSSGSARARSSRSSALRGGSSRCWASCRRGSSCGGAAADGGP